MKNLFVCILSIASSLSIVKAQTTQQRAITSFKKIEVSGATTVVYTQSDTMKLSVTADESEIANIYTTVEDEVLIIKTKGVFAHSYKVYISGNALHQITSSGASKFTVTNTLETDSLSIDISGAGDVTANIKTRVANVLSSGAGSIHLSGVTQDLYGIVGGASTLKAYKLSTENATIISSGASSAKIFTTKKINANAKGSSNINFKGNPKEVSAEASSSSSISKVMGEDANKTDKDSTSFNFRNKKFVIIDKEKDSDSVSSLFEDDDFKHWQGIGFGVNMLSSSKGDFNLGEQNNNLSLNKGKSFNWQYNLFQKNIHLYKNYINLVTGLGFNLKKYSFENKTTLNADSSYTYAKIDSFSTINYKRNELRTFYAQVPLLVEFNTNKNPHRAFHIALGVIGSYKLTSRTVQEYVQNGNKIKIVRKDDYNINPFNLNAHASIGYESYTLFMDYALTPLFQKGQGPEIYSYSIGVRILPF